MKKGLLLGKFMPPHKGHEALIGFAASRCDELTVLVCASDKEPINGCLRKEWLSTTFDHLAHVNICLLEYNEDELPNTSVSSRDVSKIWADHLLKKGYQPDLIFSSEPYGEYLAQLMGATNMPFDIDRTKVPVSATDIRSRPLLHWDLISQSARPYFIKKICLYGTESTGKTELAKRLAHHYNTLHVSEAARDIVSVTEECTYADLLTISKAHAKAIEQGLHGANKLLFVDTDLNITRSYARFLFGKELSVPAWIDAVNSFDLYLHLQPNAPYVQDGTRLPEKERLLLAKSHAEQLSGIQTITENISGSSWDERFNKAVSVIDQHLKNW